MIYTPYLSALRIVLPIALICAVWAHGCSYGERTESAKTLAAQETLKTYAEATRAAEKAAREATTTLQERIKDADAKYQAAEKENARIAADLADSLKRGTVRVSDTWACPAPTSADSAGQAASEATGARQADSLERIVSATAADEAAIDWVYARWESEHRAVIAAGCAVERQ